METVTYEAMPYRTIPLATNHYYHIYNRGVARQPIFTNKREYGRFLSALFYYQYTNIPTKLSLFLTLARDRRDLVRTEQGPTKHFVHIVCYVLMPNHFHLLVQQTQDNGIATFVSKSCNSYTKYYNTKHNRVGPLLQGPFKAVRIESEEQLLHVSRYIHLNPFVSYLVKQTNFLSYPWSSLPDYVSNARTRVWVAPILDHFKTRGSYLKFVLDQADYAKTLADMKYLILEKEERIPEVQS